MLNAAYTANPLWVRCIASDKAIFEIFMMFAGHDAMPSYELLRLGLDENPTAVKMIAQQSEAVTRSQLTEEILSLIASKNQGRDGKFDSFSLKAEENRLKHFSTEALRQRLSDIKVKQKMSSQPVGVLKQMVSDARPAPGYPTLPKQLFENGRTVTVDALYLKALDPYSLKRICRIYSTEAVNQRASGEELKSNSAQPRRKEIQMASNVELEKQIIELRTNLAELRKTLDKAFRDAGWYTVNVNRHIGVPEEIAQPQVEPTPVVRPIYNASELRELTRTFFGPSGPPTLDQIKMLIETE